MEKIKIAIADDNPLIIIGLLHLIATSPDMVIAGVYANGEELLAGLAVSQPDVLLLDIQMPGQTGDELAPVIHKKYPLIGMLALTNHDNIFYIRSMMASGVLGYILKTTGMEILLEAIRAVSRGEEYIEPVLQEKLLLETSRAQQQTAKGPVLTRAEKEVLQLMAQNLTSKGIAKILCISRRTVDNHRQSMMTKLEVKNAAALVKKATDLGLLR